MAWAVSRLALVLLRTAAISRGVRVRTLAVASRSGSRHLLGLEPGDVDPVDEPLAAEDEGHDGQAAVERAPGVLKALDDLGGWLNPDVAKWFAEYAAVMFRRLDGRVKLWATLNEPWVVTDGGYLHGVLAPGHRSRFEAPIASHRLLQSHAEAVAAYRAEGRHRIGIVVNLEPKCPASDRPDDRAAAARADAYMNRQYLDPLFHGRYPAELGEIFGEAWPEWPAEDLTRIRQPIDFLGVNYYTRSVTRFDPDAGLLQATAVRQPRATYTETGWEVHAPALTDVLVWVAQRYGNPSIYVTENGAAFFDPPCVDGERVADPLRVHYLRTHIAAVHAAMAAGADVRGYFVWSLLDNFEWALGYSKRFGIVHVDFDTQQRTPKDSARFYARVIASRGRVLNPGASTTDCA